MADKNSGGSAAIPSAQAIQQYILDAIGQIKYGSVEVLIHDSRIVQVSRSEKSRFDIPRTNQ